MEKHILEDPPLIEVTVKKTKKEMLAEEREAARVQREAEKEARRVLQEQQKQEKEQQRENERIEREKARELARKEREEAKHLKIQEREEKLRVQKEEKERVKLEKERLKEEKDKLKLAQQPKLNSFFTVRAKDPETPSEHKKESLFLPYHYKANCTFYNTKPKVKQPDDCLAWLKSQPKFEPTTSAISTNEFKTRLMAGHDMKHLVSQLNVKYIQFYETVRPAFIGTCADIDGPLFNQLCLDASLPLILTQNYVYDSDLEWTPADEDDEDLAMDDESEDDDDGTSDVGSFLASDDESGQRESKVLAFADPLVKWNDGVDAFFHEFKPIYIAQTPFEIGEFVSPQQPTQKSPQKPQQQPPNLPPVAVSEILKVVNGHTGTKALLLETLYHDLHTKFTTLTRTGLKGIIDTHAKKEKSGWVILEDKLHLLHST